MAERKFWWVAFACFIAAGVLAIVNVVMLKAGVAGPVNMWLHIVALWLIAPMAWWAVLRFTGHWKRDA